MKHAWLTLLVFVTTIVATPPSNCKLPTYQDPRFVYVLDPWATSCDALTGDSLTCSFGAPARFVYNDGSAIVTRSFCLQHCNGSDDLRRAAYTSFYRKVPALAIIKLLIPLCDASLYARSARRFTVCYSWRRPFVVRIPDFSSPFFAL